MRYEVKKITNGWIILDNLTGSIVGADYMTESMVYADCESLNQCDEWESYNYSWG
jgi:hypothetical protein